VSSDFQKIGHSAEHVANFDGPPNASAL